jgi:hypothetical protein
MEIGKDIEGKYNLLSQHTPKCELGHMQCEADTCQSLQMQNNPSERTYTATHFLEPVLLSGTVSMTS